MDHIELRSPAFPSGGAIPARFTEEAGDLSPPLEWGRVPVIAKELVLTCEDLDASSNGPSHHWIVYAIPTCLHSLREADAPSVQHGRNDFGLIGYSGPRRPEDHGVHRYRFRLLALDTPMAAPRGMRWRELQERIRGHIVAQGELIGTYESH